MQDGGRAHLGQGAELHLQRAGGEPQPVGHAHERAQAGARNRQPGALAHAVQIHVMTMPARHHGHARQPALGGLRAQNDRQLAAAEQGKGIRWATRVTGILPGKSPETMPRRPCDRKASSTPFSA